MKADVILLNPSYVYPPFSKATLKAIYDDPLVMDLPSMEFLYPPMGLLSIGGALRQAGSLPLPARTRHCDGEVGAL